MTFGEHHPWTLVMVPRLVVYLRALRAQNFDARVEAKSRWTSSPSTVIAFLGAPTLATTAFTSDEFNAFVDSAMTQL